MGISFVLEADNSKRHIESLVPKSLINHLNQLSEIERDNLLNTFSSAVFGALDLPYVGVGGAFYPDGIHIQSVSVGCSVDKNMPPEAIESLQQQFHTAVQSVSAQFLGA